MSRAFDELWRRRGTSERKTDALHGMISTPYIDGNYIYGIDSYGELRCLDAANGNRLWEDLTAVPKARWATIHMVRNQDRVWMFNERGELIIATLSPKGFHEISRAKLIEPTTEQLGQRRRLLVASRLRLPARFLRGTDRELVLARPRQRHSLAAGRWLDTGRRRNGISCAIRRVQASRLPRVAPIACLSGRRSRKRLSPGTNPSCACGTPIAELSGPPVNLTRRYSTATRSCRPVSRGAYPTSRV